MVLDVKGSFSNGGKATLCFHSPSTFPNVWLLIKNGTAVEARTGRLVVALTSKHLFVCQVYNPEDTSFRLLSHSSLSTTLEKKKGSKLILFPNLILILISPTLRYSPFSRQRTKQSPLSLNMPFHRYESAGPGMPPIRRQYPDYMLESVLASERQERRYEEDRRRRGGAPMPEKQIQQLRQFAWEQYKHNHPQSSHQIYQEYLLTLHKDNCPCGSQYRRPETRAVCDEMEEWIKIEAQACMTREENRMMNAFLPREAEYPVVAPASERHERERLREECRARASHALDKLVSLFSAIFALPLILGADADCRLNDSQIALHHTSLPRSVVLNLRSMTRDSNGIGIWDARIGTGNFQLPLAEMDKVTSRTEGSFL